MDCYKELGVEKNAGNDDIKKAYRSLAMKYHPDKAPTDKKEEYTKKFQQLSEANEILSDPEKRKIYDGHGMAGLKNPQPQHQDIFNDLFRNFGGFSFSQQQQRKNGDTTFQLDLTLKDVYCGVTKKIKITKQAIVDIKGEILKEKLENSWTKCNECNGQGSTIKAVHHGNVLQQFHQQCLKCSGCGSCLLEGFKLKEVSETVTIEIAKGLKHGEQRRFDKQGNCSPGVIPGDVVVIFNVANYKGFTRNGLDIEYTHHITLKEALCGGLLQLTMLDDKLMNISYDCIGMKDGISEKKMVSNLGFNGGNLIINFNISFPLLNNEQKEMIKKVL